MAIAITTTTIAAVHRPPLPRGLDAPRRCHPRDAHLGLVVAKYFEGDASSPDHLLGGATNPPVPTAVANLPYFSATASFASHAAPEAGFQSPGGGGGGGGGVTLDPFL